MKNIKNKKISSRLSLKICSKTKKKALNFGIHTHLLSMRDSVFYIIFSFFLIPIHSQVLSVDRENGQDSIKRKVAFSYNVSFSSDRQKKNLLEFSNQTELDVFLKRDKIIILLGNVY